MCGVFIGRALHFPSATRRTFIPPFTQSLRSIPAATSWYLADLGEAIGKQQLFTAGLNAYFYRDHLKAQVNYVRRHELSGPQVPNDIGFVQLQAAF